MGGYIISTIDTDVLFGSMPDRKYMPAEPEKAYGDGKDSPVIRDIKLDQENL